MTRIGDRRLKVGLVMVGFTRRQSCNEEVMCDECDSVTISVTPGVMTLSWGMEDAAHLEMSRAQHRPPPGPGWPRTDALRTPLFHCSLKSGQHSANLTANWKTLNTYLGQRGRGVEAWLGPPVF